MKPAIKVVIAVLITGAVGYWLCARSPQIKRNVALRDSIAYWAAGNLLIHHQNPYDHQTVLEIERAAGYQDQRPLVLRTPPWSLFMVAAVGLLSAFWAWVFWILLSLVSLFAGMRLCAKMYGGKTPPNLMAIVGYTLAPVPACLVSGQMGLILMSGVVLFLWLEPRSPFWAGAALILPFAKPHLLTAFWLVLVIWVLHRKNRQVALGFIAALVLTIGVAVAFDPLVFRQYREMLHAAAIGNEFIPAFSGVLRLLFFRRLFWVQFMPMAVGVIWCVFFYARNASCWDWRKHGPALAVVSVLVTPYEWLSDETVLLPAMLQALALVYAARDRLQIRSKIAIVAFALLNLLLLLILKSKVPFSTGIYFWSSLVWFLWYFQARKWYSQRSTPQERQETQLATQPPS